MSLKKKIGMGVATAALGLSLVGGGVFAYFSDTETSNNTFAAGTLDLSVKPTEIIKVDKIKPGDTMTRTFKLINGGNLDISRVELSTNNNVIDAKGDNTDNFANHIRVNFLKNEDKNGVLQPEENVIVSTTLADLEGDIPDAVENQINAWFGWGDEASGLKAGDSDELIVQFEFVENKKDQNEFQGDSLELEWTFDAKQTAGERR